MGSEDTGAHRVAISRAIFWTGSMGRSKHLRGAASSELMAAISTTDPGLALVTTLHDVFRRSRDLEVARRQRDGQQPPALQIEFCFDSM
eukprot:4527231-Pyramimonas_sp.AAC.1